MDFLAESWSTISTAARISHRNPSCCPKQWLQYRVLLPLDLSHFTHFHSTWRVVHMAGPPCLMAFPHGAGQHGLTSSLMRCGRIYQKKGGYKSF